MIAFDRQSAFNKITLCVIGVVVSLSAATGADAGFILSSDLLISPDLQQLVAQAEATATGSRASSDLDRASDQLPVWLEQSPQPAFGQNSGFSGMSSGSSSSNSSPPPASLSPPLELSPPASFVQGVPRAFYSPRICVTGVFRPPMSV